MTAVVLGKQSWRGGRDEEGFRTYELTLLVESAFSDGPQKVILATGMPLIGAPWVFGGDSDPWAFNTPYMGIRPVVSDGDKNDHWLVDLKFTNKPMKRCCTTTIEDPLLEPQKVSGSFVKYTTKTTKDYLGKVIKNSSLEPVPIERDASRPTVTISQNVAALGIDTFSQMIDTLNNSTLWGLAKRKIKLSTASWERKYYGVCSVYYTRNFEFEVRFDGFDEAEIVDQGLQRRKGDYKAGVWVPDPTVAAIADNKLKPEHMTRIKDAEGNVLPPQLLDGHGNVNNDPEASIAYLPTVKIYKESNFLTLGIPTSL